MPNWVSNTLASAAAGLMKLLATAMFNDGGVAACVAANVAPLVNANSKPHSDQRSDLAGNRAGKGLENKVVHKVSHPAKGLCGHWRNGRAFTLAARGWARQQSAHFCGCRGSVGRQNRSNHHVV